MPPDTTPSPNQDADAESSAGLFVPIVGLVLVIGVAFVFLRYSQRNLNPPPSTDTQPDPILAAAYTGDYSTMGDSENVHSPTNILTYWWGTIPDAMRQISANTGTNSNITIDDYASSASCVTCHSNEHGQWRTHSHRQMNAKATAENVLGDFSDSAAIEYQGGRVRFLTRLGSFRMLLTKGKRTRRFQITQTIGSRIHQYYVGIMIEGEESEAEELRLVEHVMPFAWSVESREWIPTSHAHRNHERSDDQVNVFASADIVPYEAECAGCHTTNPFGDWLLPYANADRMSAYAPHPVAFEISHYLATQHPKIVPDKKPGELIRQQEYEDVSMRSVYLGMEGNRIENGISCEACHYGSRVHAENSTKDSTSRPTSWFPVNPHLQTLAQNNDGLAEKSHANTQLMCAQCHTDKRPTYANGAHTWHSAELTDALNGACYLNSSDTLKPLTCTHCHDAHESSAGLAKADLISANRMCTSCHQDYLEPSALAAHTHHDPTSVGSNCMDCHMPRITEGLRRVVRSHRITKPTERGMIEKNQPNACNLCHLDKPIDWTIEHLREWYGSQHEYAEFELDTHYPDRGKAVARGWLKSTHSPTRLIAADALARDELSTNVSALLGILVNDSNADVRRFTQRRIEEQLKLRLLDDGYAFYLTENQRRAAVELIRNKIATKAAARE